MNVSLCRAMKIQSILSNLPLIAVGYEWPQSSPDEFSSI